MIRKREILAGAKYASKAYNLTPWEVETYWEDILQESEVGFYNDNDTSRNASSRFIYSQVKYRGLTGGHNAYKHLKKDEYEEMLMNNTSISRLPVIALTRLLYKLLKMRPGRRRRHSAALKALILADRCDGIIFDVIAEKYEISIDNAKRHYWMAWTLLRGWFSQNTAMLSSKQFDLFQSCTLKDVRNVTKKKGERYYDYSRRYSN